jgi:hypothetical protein
MITLMVKLRAGRGKSWKDDLPPQYRDQYVNKVIMLRGGLDMPLAHLPDLL